MKQIKVHKPCICPESEEHQSIRGDYYTCRITGKHCVQCKIYTCEKTCHVNGSCPLPKDENGVHIWTPKETKIT